MKTIAWNITKRTVTDFISDDAMSLGAALAFYTALSIAPLLVIVLAIAGFVWQEGDLQAEIVRQTQTLIGPTGAEAIGTVMKEAGKERAHGIAAVVGAITLLFGATSVFAQLQYSLNRIWNVESKPGQDVKDFVRKRVLSLGMILVLAFLLVVSLVVSAGLSFAASSTRVNLPGADWLWPIVNLMVSLGVYTGLFTLMHHFLPDVKISWRDSLVGGVATALLFALGKELLGWYLGQKSTTSAYGAAGSFLVVLLWVYYSSLIVFIGAEFTQAYASVLGHPIKPEAHARMIPKPLEEPAAAARPA